MNQYINKPTPAFVAASWVALVIGGAAYMLGLFNANMPLNEKGYYLLILFYALFASVSLQKVIRDRLEGLKVTAIYFGLCWTSIGICIALLGVGLLNAELAFSEKGFYIMAFLLALFGAVAVQKNIRDMEYLRRHNHNEMLDLPESNHSSDNHHEH